MLSFTQEEKKIEGDLTFGLIRTMALTNFDSSLLSKGVISLVERECGGTTSGIGADYRAVLA